MLKSRIDTWKGRERLKMSTCQRVQRFVQLQKKHHDKRVFANRGCKLIIDPVQLFGIGNNKQNLGNSLYISDRYIRDLDTDINQSSPEPPFLMKTVNTSNFQKSVVWIHFQGRPKNNETLEKIFNEASEMVYNVFAEKAIEMDLLSGVSKEDFSVDTIVDPSTGEVLSAIEYVYMRKYVWVECFAVKQSYQKSGIGKLMMERLNQIATNRRKDVLLYSLLDVVSFYEHYGFQLCPKCLNF